MFFLNYYRYKINLFFSSKFKSSIVVFKNIFNLFQKNKNIDDSWGWYLPLDEY